jgi:hypothetical protein
MRKVLAGVLAGAALIALAACGGGSSETATAPDGAGSAQANTASAAASGDAATSSMAELKGSMGALAAAAADVAGDAARVAGDVIDTKTACQLAGQSPQLCGCIAEELGPRLSGDTIAALTQVLRDAAGGELAKVTEGATGALDPATREALTRCAVESAVQGAVSEAAGQ